MAQQNFSGQTFGQYELREVLGVGGMGTVYRAYQQALRRAVAIKVLPATLAEDPEFVERFHREAETAAALEHPHIIPVYDYGMQNGLSFIVMRLLTGGALSDRLKGSKGSQDQILPSLGEIATLLHQLAGAFDYAHIHGVIHRDIKPSNIMFDNQGNAFLVDFGIAKLLEHTHHLTATGAVLGTPYYMAPEQWRTEEIAPATDQYALAVTVYQLLTGQVPFQSATPFGLMHKHLNEVATPPHLVRTEAPEEVSMVLNRAMAKAPAERFPTVTAFAQAFERATSPQPGQATGFFTALPDEMTFVPTPSTPLREPRRTPLSQTDTKEAAGTAPAPVVVPETVLDRTRSTPPPFYRRPAVGGGIIVLLALIAAVVAVLALGRGNDDNAPSDGEMTETAQAALLPTDAPAETSTATLPALTPTNAPSATSLAIVVVPTTEQPLSSATPTETPTEAPLIVLASETPTAPATFTLIPTNTEPPTATLTETPTPDLAATVEALAVQALTSTAQSWTATPTATDTATITPTATATFTPSPTATFTATSTATLTPSLTPTMTFTPTTTLTPSPVFTPTATLFGGGLSQIVFVSERDGNREIYRANADGTSVTRLTNSPGDDWDPVWSPDGSQIAFHSMREGNAEIYVMSADGSNVYNLSKSPSTTEYHPVWSPDGTQILFYSDRDGNGELYAMNADGSNPRNLTRHDAQDGGGSWSPDGNWIVFVSERGGSKNPDLYVMDASGNNAVRLTDDSANDAWPAWSPDGRQIAFASNRTGHLQVYTMNTDGSHVVRLTNTSAEEWWPAWSPDGNYLLYTTTRDGIGSVYIMDANGSNPRALTSPSAWDYSAAWRPAPESTTVPVVIFASPVPAPTSDYVCELQFAAVINIRTGPGTGYGMLGTTATNVNLPVNGRSSDGAWWRILYDNQFGWVASTLASVQAVGDCSGVPVVSG